MASHSSQTTDQELMRNYKAGDETAFALIYERYKGNVYGYLAKRLQDPVERDEVFQNAFMKFHRARAQYDSQYALLQWLYVITRSELLDHLKRGTRSVPTLPIDDIENLSQKEESSSLIEGDQLAVLKPEQNRIVTMKVIDELSYQEIATQLERSEVSVRQIFSRSIRKLKLLTKGTPHESP